MVFEVGIRNDALMNTITLAQGGVKRRGGGNRKKNRRPDCSSPLAFGAEELYTGGSRRKSIRPPRSRDPEAGGMRPEETMEKREAVAESQELVKRSMLALVGSNGDGGYPNIKTMIKADHEGLMRIWFGTNTSSRRIAQFRRDPRACVYFLDSEAWKGLMLVGEMEILQDAETRRRLWRPGDEKYYPLGIDDPDYSVLRFTAARGNFYHALANADFDVE
jgi:general stress protein 26